MSLVNWTANVILPMFALTQLAAMALHMGGVVSEIYPGSTWIRKFIAAIGALMVSGMVRLGRVDGHASARDWRVKHMSLDMTPVHRNLHTKVTFLGLEFEDLILVLALAAVMNLLAHFVSGNAHVFGIPLNVFMEFVVPGAGCAVSDPLQVRQAAGISRRPDALAYRSQGVVRA